MNDTNASIDKFYSMEIRCFVNSEVFDSWYNTYIIEHVSRSQQIMFDIYCKTKNGL